MILHVSSKEKRKKHKTAVRNLFYASNNSKIERNLHFYAFQKNIITLPV